MANGVMGGLSAWLENKRRVARRQLGDLLSSPQDFGRMQASRFREDQEKYMSDPATGLDFVAGPLGALAGVIKPKGGNWLTGSVESALKDLKPWPSSRPGDIIDPQDLPMYTRNNALGSWIEGPLQKYIKTQMATPEDPVRALMEQSISHDPRLYNFEAADLYEPSQLRWAREDAGFGQMGKSPAAKEWENITDTAVGIRKPGDLEIAEQAENPWLERLSPDEDVYDLPSPVLTGTAGFNHLTDELRNALNPESGLPRNLLLRPEQLKQMGMEKAVRHVDAINKWRAVQKIAADQELANKASVMREYAENNPKGLRWVELKPRKSDKEPLPSPEEFEAANAHLGPKEWDEAVNWYRKERDARLDNTEIRKELEAQLRYEGDTMGHCVGGYCDDVMEGRSRIFSLRDAKGEPHVTVEVAKPSIWDTSQNIFDEWYDKAAEIVRDRRGLKSIPKDVRTNDALDELHDEIGNLADELYRVQGEGTPTITQIKGKQNRAPKEEYLPFVQDFVRNNPLGDKWGDVGDFDYTGLRRAADYQHLFNREIAPLLGKEGERIGKHRFNPPEQEYMTPAEIRAWIEGQAPEDVNPEFWQGLLNSIK